MKSIILFLLFLPLATFSQAPGGVSSNIKLWVKAELGISTSGANIIDWDDQTNTNTFSVTGTPKFASHDVNYNFSIAFDGSSRFVGNTSIANTTHAFVVGKIANPSGVTASGALMGSTTVSSHQYFFHTQGGTLYCGGNTNSIYTGYTSTNSVPYSILSEDLGKTPAAADMIRLNGENKTNSSGNDPAVYNGIPTIGSRGTENILNGSEIAEAILYNTSLSAVNVNKIESYLAIKYGITLSNAGGGTAGDYTSSGGTIIWDADNGSGYHNDVIGIGRNDNSALIQRQSRQSDDSTRIYLSELGWDNWDNDGVFATNNQFIMMGHNGQKLRHTFGNNEYPAGLGIYSRIDREWKITNTNFTGTFSLDVKLNTSPVTASHLRILVDDDGNFSNAALYNPTISYSGGEVTISGISNSMIPANTTKYLTIVSINSSTPLPVGLVNFTAAAFENKYVNLNWQTASENNNRFFGIERSTDGNQWQEIGRVNGADNSARLLSYSYVDNNPVERTCYYRLKQVDNDGNFSYSEIRIVKPDLSAGKELMIYPNPATGQIIIKAKEKILPGIIVYDATGRNVSPYVKTTVTDDWRLMVDLANLPPGIYILKTKNAVAKLMRL